jgi:thiol-disulfide isomerase/thioredoxin
MIEREVRHSMKLHAMKSRWRLPSGVRGSLHLLPLVMLTALLFAAVPVAARGASPEDAGPPPIHFFLDLPTALADARDSGKPVIVVFAAVWCPNCRTMEEETFTSPEIRGLADRFLWVQIDIDRNPTLTRAYEVTAVPAVYFLDSSGTKRGETLGAMEPVAFRGYLQQFLDNLGVEPKETSGAQQLNKSDPRQTGLIYTPDGYRGLSICFSHVGYGPLRMESQSPFQVLRLGLVPRTPSTLARGQMEVRAAETWSNTFSNSPDEYFLDFETLDSSISLAYGLTNELQIEAEFQNRSRFGGVMDGFIQGFHDLFGIDQNGRQDHPKGDFQFQLNPGAGRPSVALDSSDEGTFSQNMLLTLQHNVTCGGRHRPAFSYAVTSRFELNDSGDFNGGRSVDLGVSVSASRRFRSWYVYQTFGFSWFGENEFRGIPLQNHQFSSLTAFEWRYRPNMSFLFQYLYSGGVVDDFGPFSEPSHELNLGWKGEIAKGFVLEAGLIENIITFDNSPDLGFHLGLAWRI